jgi:predicted ribosomally synthesized peptide with nif11-like leader
MSQKNAAALLAEGHNNLELGAKLNRAKSAEDIVAIGIDAGFEFTIEELNAELATISVRYAEQKNSQVDDESEELSRDELAVIAGGQREEEIRDRMAKYDVVLFNDENAEYIKSHCMECPIYREPALLSW